MPQAIKQCINKTLIKRARETIPFPRESHKLSHLSRKNCMKKTIVQVIADRQSTIASGLAALLIIVGGFLVFNYFSGQTKLKSPTITPEATQSAQQNGSGSLGTNRPASLASTTQISLPTSYTVVRGDSLSKIAQKFYGDQGKWVEIAKANNLAKPSVIHAGNVLSIPQIDADRAPASQASTGSTAVLGSTSQTTIKPGSTYTVTQGDTLWELAQVAYGSGYEWYRIDQANSPIPRNSLGKPLIVPGQTLKIP